MKPVRIFFVLLLAALPAFAAESGCWFQRPDAPVVQIPAQMKSVRLLDYYRIYYLPSDSLFADTDRSGLPTVLAKKEAIMDQALHLLQTELAWPLPSSRMELGRPELDVFFVVAPRKFTGAASPGRLIFNRNILNSGNFASIWIHQLAHAAELRYRPSGDYWFYEATAGWMEGQMGSISPATLEARADRQAHPEISLIDSSPEAALGASRFLDLLARPYRDVIRQIWDQWSYAKDEGLIDIINRVLSLNHAPDFESYLQNFFLLSKAEGKLDRRTTTITVKPYSAAAFRAGAEQSSGGEMLAFLPSVPGKYSAGLLYFAQGEGSGTLALKKGITEPWSVQIPFAGMDHYDLVLVNSGAQPLRGTLQRTFDAAIPGILEYFRVNPGEGGVEIEWKTAREDGVAFWNLYRVEQGKKVLLTDFPIPATIQSQEGTHYLYIDSSAGVFYSLEAITSEGFASPFAGAETPQ